MNLSSLLTLVTVAVMLTSVAVGTVVAQDSMPDFVEVNEDIEFENEVRAGEETTITPVTVVENVPAPADVSVELTMIIDGEEVESQSFDVRVSDGTVIRRDYTHTFESSGEKKVEFEGVFSAFGQTVTGTVSEDVTVLPATDEEGGEESDGETDEYENGEEDETEERDEGDGNEEDDEGTGESREDGTEEEAEDGNDRGETDDSGEEDSDDQSGTDEATDGTDSDENGEEGDTEATDDGDEEVGDSDEGGEDTNVTDSEDGSETEGQGTGQESNETESGNDGATGGESEDGTEDAEGTDDGDTEDGTDSGTREALPGFTYLAVVLALGFSVLIYARAESR